MTVVCVLRGGGDYRPHHVDKLRGMVDQHLPHDRFVCYSDQDLPCEVELVQLLHNWPGWWAKMEIFRTPGPCVYFDLDTVIRGDCRGWLGAIDGAEFVALRDFYRGRSDPRALQSSLMYWAGDMSWIYRQFAEQPEFTPGGDQMYLQRHLPAYELLQDYTDAACSFKACYRQDAQVVIFHGHPRPWQQTQVDY